LRFRQPEPPRVPGADNVETALLSRLELAGYRPAARLAKARLAWSIAPSTLIPASKWP